MLANPGQNWECPYCRKAQVVGRERWDSNQVKLDVDANYYGPVITYIASVACANQDCRRLSLEMSLHVRGKYTNSGYQLGSLIKKWQLMPESSAKPLPEHIPEAIRQDYVEACGIRDLSPKASATLARRCLQGMIRDFCGISKNRLVDEIDALKAAVDTGSAPPGVQADTLDAIDHVRKIGNIGAHMERDINVIVDVDKDEAQTLIGLLELLFDEWYIARHTRKARLAKIGVVAASKEAAKKLAAPLKQLSPPSDATTDGN